MAKNIVLTPSLESGYVKGSTATTVYNVAVGESINSAIDTATAAGGGIVTLAAGTHTVDAPVIVKDNVSLWGAGKGVTTIKANSSFLSTDGPNGGHPLITTNGADNVTLQGFTADQSEQLFSQATVGGDRHSEFLIDVRNSNNVMVQNISVRNPFTYCITVYGSTNFCVKGCDTRVESVGRWDQVDGIHIMESSYGWVLNNDVDQRYNGAEDGDDGLVAHTLGAAPCHHIVYHNNLVRGGHRGNSFQLAADDSDIYNIVIQNNEFYGAPEGIRTGYYGGETGNVHDILIGGEDGKGNLIRDLVPGFAFPDGGHSVWIFDAPSVPSNTPTNVVVSYNTIDATDYEIDVVANSGNVVANNTIL